MKRRLLTILFVLLIQTSGKAELSDIPDYTILVSRVNEIIMVDDFALTATADGIAVFQYDTSMAAFVFVNQIYFDFFDASLKLYDNILVVMTGSERLHFIDVSLLPELDYLGPIDFNVSFSDYVFVDSEVYISVWFEGIWRFTINDFQTAQFIDSSMQGIAVTQLEKYDSILYALDEYNGLMRYDISGNGFGIFIDYLYIPQQTSSFIKYDTLFCFLLTSGGVYFGDFKESGSMIVDSLLDIPPMKKAFFTDSLLLLLTPRQMYLINRNNLNEQSIVDISNNFVDGDLFNINNQTHLVLPDSMGGMTLFNLEEDTAPIKGLYRYGWVEDILIYNNKLFTGGLSNPVDVYDIDNSAQVTYDYTIFNNQDSVSHMTHNGDTLIVLYPHLDLVGFIMGSSHPEFITWVGSFDVDASGVEEIEFLQQKIGFYNVLLVKRQEVIDVYTISNYPGINLVNSWGFTGTIQTVSVKDSFLYVTTSKKQIRVYKINQNYDLEYITNIGLSKNTFESIIVDNRLVVFGWDEMYVLDITSPQSLFMDAIISIPIPVVDAAFYDNKLFTIGPDGINIFDFSLPQPVLLEYGGLGSEFLAVGSNIIATSYGNGIYLYIIDDSGIVLSTPEEETLPSQFLLTQNFPNPFNPETSIKYSLPIPGRVELVIYNILGQKVITLVNEKKPAGEHIVIWDGKNRAGNLVTTGIYFYRLSVNGKTETRKMILIK